jgi:eukaryotic-like serine/threonine-protein kinase
LSSSEPPENIEKQTLKGLESSPKKLGPKHHSATRPLNFGLAGSFPDKFDGLFDGGEFEIDPQVESLIIPQPEKENRVENNRELVLGDYVIDSVLGVGGMGQVFKARHRTMDRWVAVKVLPSKFVNHSELVDRFYSEIRAVGRLMHPNIVTAFDAGCDQGVHYLVMELIDGNVLSSIVANEGIMSTAKVVAVLGQAAAALDYAHSLGIIHRDIKPSNLMLTKSGMLKILDFGLARFNLQAEEIERDRRQQMMGTVEYMSPEQINAPETVDHRSDLYSLGATIFFLLTGRPMFQGEPVQTALAHIKSKPPALYEVRGDIDLRLDSIFQRLVAKSPADRFATGGILLEAMQSLNLIDPSSIVQPRDSALSKRSLRLGRESLTDGFRSESTAIKKYSAVGIELGMLQSRVSFIDSQFVLKEVMLDGLRKPLSHMIWSDGTQLLIGKAASEARAKAPQHIFYGFQRWFGLPALERPFSGKQTPPEVLLATMIRHMINMVDKEQAGTTHAVVTIPACYDQLHRRSVIYACKIAGIEVLQLLEKPLAATIAHVELRVGLKTSQIPSKAASTDKTNSAYTSATAETSKEIRPQHFLVCSLNGTGCEATVVRFSGRTVESIGTVGDWKRGLLRWHHRLAEHLAGWLLREHSLDIKGDLALASKLQRFVESCFEQLTTQGKIELIFETNAKRLPIRMSSQELMAIAGELKSDLARFATQAMQAAAVESNQIDEVLLIGDLLQFPAIRSTLSGLFPANVPCQMITQAQLAKGAAIQSQYLMPPGNTKCPYAEPASIYDLGLVIQHTSNHISSPKVLIPKITVLPASISKTLRFASTKESQPIIQFVESTRQGGHNWNRLATIDLSKCFSGRPVTDPLQLRLDLDSSGLWSGTATWLAKNATITLDSLTENSIDDPTIRRWREWVESLILCNLEVRT